MRTLISVLLVGLFAADGVLADDLFAPDWRGQPNAIMARWDNWDNFPDPMVPDLWSFQVSGPDVPLGLAAPGSELLDSYMGREEVLYVPGLDGLVLELDNYDQDRLEKQVRVQITFNVTFPNGAAAGFFDVVSWYDGVPGPDVVVLGQVVGGTQMDDFNWVTEAYDFTLSPNPEFETIGLKFNQDFAYIDQVVVDTWCVPEPATLLLLVLGIAPLVLGRGRKIRSAQDISL